MSVRAESGTTDNSENMLHKNFKNIEKVTYGRGAFSQLAETVKPVRKENKNYFVCHTQSPGTHLQVQRFDCFCFGGFRGRV